MMRAYFYRQLIALSLFFCMLGSMIHPAFADDIYAVIDQVVADDRFEHIDTHLTYGVSQPPRLGFAQHPQQLGRPDPTGHYHNWIQFFLNNNDERYLPTTTIRAYSLVPQPDNGVRQIIREKAPAFLMCMEQAVKHCHRPVYEQLRRDYQKQVLDPLNQLKRDTDFAESSFKRNFTIYNDAARANLGNMVKNTLTNQANVSPENAEKVNKVMYAVSAGRAAVNVNEIIAAGISTANPFLAIGGALLAIYQAGNGISSYMTAKDYVVRALANMKMSMLYQLRITPYVNGLKTHAEERVKELDAKFQDAACWTGCGNNASSVTFGPPPVNALDICPQYYRQQGAFSPNNNQAGAVDNPFPPVNHR